MSRGLPSTACPRLTPSTAAMECMRKVPVKSMGVQSFSSRIESDRHPPLKEGDHAIHWAFLHPPRLRSRPRRGRSSSAGPPMESGKGGCSPRGSPRRRAKAKLPRSSSPLQGSGPFDLSALRARPHRTSGTSLFGDADGSHILPPLATGRPYRPRANAMTSWDEEGNSIPFTTAGTAQQASSEDSWRHRWANASVTAAREWQQWHHPSSLLVGMFQASIIVPLPAVVGGAFVAEFIARMGGVLEHQRVL